MWAVWQGMSASTTKISVAHYGPDSVLGSGDMSANKIDKQPCPGGAWYLDSKQLMCYMITWDVRK